MSSAKLSKSIMIRKIITLLLSCSLVFGSVSFSFASSVTPSNLTPYLQSNSGYYWINPNNGYSSTVSSGTKLVDMIGQLGGNLSQGVYNILSKLSNTGRIYLYNYSGTNSSYNAGTSLGDLVGYGFQYLTQTNGLIYDKVDDLLTGVNSIKGYVDGVETGLTSVNTNLTNIKSDTNSIKGYIDGLEQGQSDIVNAVESISIPSTDLTTVHSYLSNIASDVELSRIYDNGIDSTLDYIADEMFLNSSGTLADDIENILYSNRDILNSFGYSYGDTLKDGINGVVNVGSDIISSVDSVHDINTTISAISGDILTVNTSMSAIQTSIAGINQGIHEDTTSISSILAEFKDNYNDIDWNEYHNFLGAKSNYNDSSYITSSDVYSGLYFYFPYVDGNLFKIKLPTGLNNLYDSSVEFYVGTQQSFSHAPVLYSESVVTLSTSSNQTTLLAYVPYRHRSGGYLCIYVKPQIGALYYNPNNSVASLSVLDENSKDFYDVQNFAFNWNILDLFRDAKFMFFDDETIQAKKDNASQTSAVIDGFTADGDASASASDFVIVKDSVSSVKSGVNTNVSASEVLTIFNNSDGYGFWSTDCLNALDTTNSNRLLRSRSGSYTPLYDEKLQALYNAMGVNND